MLKIKYAPYFLLLSFFAMTILSCGKDSDYEAQFVGTWASVKYQNNGNEISTTISDELQLKSDNAFSRRVITRNPITLEVASDNTTSGSWSANESSKRLVLTEGGNELSMQVNTIDEMTLAVSYSDNSIPILIEFEKQ